MFGGLFVMPSFAVIGSVLLLAASTGGSPDTRSQSPGIRMFVGGNFGPGWWTLDIDSTWMMTIKVVGQADELNPGRRLTSAEQRHLLGLLAALPKQRSRYRFLGPNAIDLTVDFSLSVGAGNAAREYLVNDSFSDYAQRPETKPILNIMHLLRNLIKGNVAHVPPPVAWTSPK